MTRPLTILFCLLLTGGAGRATLPRRQAEQQLRPTTEIVGTPSIALMVPSESVSIKQPHPRTLTLAWNPAQSATGYVVNQGMSAGTYTNSLIVTGTSCRFTNLPPSGQLHFVIQSFLGSLAGPMSCHITFTSWGCVVTFTGQNPALATASLFPANWQPVTLPLSFTNPPGTLFVRASSEDVNVSQTLYPNP